LKLNINFDKNALGYVLGAFLTNFSGQTGQVSKIWAFLNRLINLGANRGLRLFNFSRLFWTLKNQENLKSLIPVDLFS
jgi:hypothetical protein